MPANSVHNSLIQSFSPSDKQHWKRAASRELNGKDPLESLLSKNGDGIEFFPYYDRDDFAILAAGKTFQLPPAETSFSGPRHWLNAPPITVHTEEKSNGQALEHLMSGADGIFFDISALPAPSFDILLENIDWSSCSLFLRLRPEHAVSLRKYLSANYASLHNLSGALFWESIPKRSELEFFLRNTKNIRALGIAISSSSPADEIAAALTSAVAVIERLDPPDEVQAEFFRAIAFSMTLGSDFVENACKLKALRGLWFQAARAYTVKDYRISDLHIHTHCEKWMANDFDPHANMLKGTTAAMAAIAGGCDSLTIAPENEANTMMNRIARNVSSVLREESHFNKVADPLAGSYTFEVATAAISAKAWSLFLTNVRK